MSLRAGGGVCSGEWVGFGRREGGCGWGEGVQQRGFV